MSPSNRRSFLHRSQGAGVLLGLSARSTARPWARPLGANDAIRVAIVGLRKKGIQHIEVLPEGGVGDLERSPLTLGPILTFDERQERFVDQHSEWANMYVKRNYREPFVVPEVV